MKRFFGVVAITGITIGTLAVMGVAHLALMTVKK